MTAGGREAACYVYGVVPADTATPDELTGLGEPPAVVTVLNGTTVAAVVSELPAAGPLGTARDLRAHARVLDTLAAGGIAVLPFRFGAVLADGRAVAEELLAPAEQQFRGALDELDGWVQYTLRGRYREERVLLEVLEGRPDISALRESTRELPEELGRDRRIRLGELVAEAVSALRAEDLRRLLDRIAPLAGSFRDHPPSDEAEAIHVAFLVRTEDCPEFERVAEALAESWAGRVELRLLGPLAAYDFAEEAVELASEVRPDTEAG